MASLNSDLPPPKALHSNWVVQKFGGTSVGKFALNIIEQVVLYAPSILSFVVYMISPQTPN
jgi:aspartate kinase